MAAIFDINTSSARRKATGSIFRLNQIPMEFSGYNCFYGNAENAYEIGFLAIFAAETFALKHQRYEHVIQQPVVTHVVLAKGSLRMAIQQKHPSDFPSSAIDVLVQDVYELMKAFFLNNFNGSYDLKAAEVEISIWEAEPKRFGEAFSDNLQRALPAPALVQKLQAIRIS